MSKLLFGYDLNKAGQDCAGLISAVKTTFPNYWHCLDSTWIVETALTPPQLRDGLRARVDANDEIFVVDITGKAAAWAGFSTACDSWLNSNL